MGTFAILIQIVLKFTYEIFDSTWNSVSDIYYACLIRQIAKMPKSTRLRALSKLD